MLSVSVGILIIFLYCYFGALGTESYEKMADALFESNWPDLPVTLQKYIVIMIAGMQKPIHYHGFGIANLNLKTFISVKKKNNPNQNSVGKIKFFFFNICVVLVYQQNLFILHDA